MPKYHIEFTRPTVDIEADDAAIAAKQAYEWADLQDPRINYLADLD